MSDTWVNLDGVHYNTATMQSFMWRSGCVIIHFVSGLDVKVPDFDGKRYEKLCETVRVRELSRTAR